MTQTMTDQEMAELMGGDPSNELDPAWSEVLESDPEIPADVKEKLKTEPKAPEDVLLDDVANMADDVLDEAMSPMMGEPAQALDEDLDIAMDLPSDEDLLANELLPDVSVEEAMLEESPIEEVLEPAMDESVEEATDEMEVLPEIPTEQSNSETVFESSDEDVNAVCEQAEQAVHSMEEAINVSNEISDLATEALQAAQQATALANAAATEKLDSASSKQSIIERSFQAMERALSVVKSSGTPIPDMSSVNFSELSQTTERLSQKTNDLKMKTAEMRAKLDTLRNEGGLNG